MRSAAHHLYELDDTTQNTGKRCMVLHSAPDAAQS